MAFSLVNLSSIITVVLNQSPWLFLILGLFAGYQMSRIMIAHIAPIGFYDIPSADRTNSTDLVPRTAGLAFMASLFIGHQFGFIALPFLNTLLWGVLGFIGLLGLADDFNRKQPIAFITSGFKAKYTLIIAMITALGLLWPLQATPETITSNSISVSRLFEFTPQFYLSQPMNFVFFGYPLPSLYLFLFLGITLLCWGIPNLFNLIDGLDGLAMGYFGMVIFVVMRFPNGDLIPGPGFWGLWAMVFYLNLKKIHYLGDVGSLSMGLFLAVTSVLYIQSHLLEHFLFLFAYPILDTLHVILLRWKQNRPLGQGDNCHLHHFIWRQTKKSLTWTLPILWTLGFLPMLRLWGSPNYQQLSLIGLGLLVIVLGFSFTVQFNEKTAPIIKS